MLRSGAPGLDRSQQGLARKGRKACAQNSPPNLWLLEQMPAFPRGCDVETSRITLGKGLPVFGLVNKALLCEISYFMNQLFEDTSGLSPGPPRNVSFQEARTHPAVEVLEAWRRRPGAAFSASPSQALSSQGQGCAGPAWSEAALAGLLGPLPHRCPGGWGLPEMVLPPLHKLQYPTEEKIQS